MLLELGSTGDDVKKLQTKLGLTADGVFDINTQEKVKEWQSQNGLTADGIVGSETWNKLFAEFSQNEVIDTDVFNKLKGLIPEHVFLQLPDTSMKFNISNVLRLAHFLAQCAHESAGFTVNYENLNYSEDGLTTTFGKYFPGNLSATYARNPVKIASRVYASRMGNGDEETGDGYKYRGRGYIQLTGRNNYRAFAQFIGEDTEAQPDLVADKYPLASAAFFFYSNNIWKKCDNGASEEDVTVVTKAVNGGINGLNDRLAHFYQYHSAITSGFRFLENPFSSSISSG